MTTPARRALGLVAVAMTAAAVLAACSGDDGSPAASASPSPSSSLATSAGAEPSARSTAPTVGEVYRAARTAALSAPSGHVVGTQTREGRTLRIDVEGNATGSNQTAFITTPEGGVAEVRTVGAEHWLGGDEAFWVEQTGDPAAGKDMVGRYVSISESDATELGSFTLRTILAEAFVLPEIAALETDGDPVEEVTLDGVDAYLLGDEGEGQLWVAADGSGTLLRVVGPASAPADLVFSDWGTATTFAAPPASQVTQG